MPLLILALFLAPVPSVLSPEAGEHNTAAMRFYDDRQLEQAFKEFRAGYDAMPDPRRDLAGREMLLGSMHATLLELHEASGAPEPLCRMQALLQAHADALAAAHPESPDMLELLAARARHTEVTRKLTAIGPEACAPPEPPPPLAPAPPVSAPTPPVGPGPAAVAPPNPTSGDAPIAPRHLRIAGGVTLGLGAGLLGVMTYAIVSEARGRARVDAFDGAMCPLGTAEHDELLALRDEILGARYLAIGTGVAAGVTAALGTTLLVLARRSARARRLALAPWWSRTGAGLTLRVHLGPGR